MYANCCFKLVCEDRVMYTQCNDCRRAQYGAQQQTVLKTEVILSLWVWCPEQQIELAACGTPHQMKNSISKDIGVFLKLSVVCLFIEIRLSPHCSILCCICSSKCIWGTCHEFFKAQDFSRTSGELGVFLVVSTIPTIPSPSSSFSSSCTTITSRTFLNSWQIISLPWR